LQQVLSVSGDYESTKVAVIAAMIFPRSPVYRRAYELRQALSRRPIHEGTVRIGVPELRLLTDGPSRAEIRAAALSGTREGTVAGDLVALIFEQSRRGAPEPSLRSALSRYQAWALGRTYGDGGALKYSAMTLRTYLDAAAPSAHLWAAQRLMTHEGERSNALTRAGLPRLLGLARAIQDFACTFVPKRTKPPKSVLSRSEVILVPEWIDPIEP
jgi:hypothetical protein